MNYLILIIFVCVIVGDIILCRKNFIWSVAWLSIPVILGFVVTKTLWPVAIVLLCINIAYRMHQQEKSYSLLSGKQLYRLQQQEEKRRNHADSSVRVEKRHAKNIFVNFDLNDEHSIFLSSEYAEGRALKRNYRLVETPQMVQEESAREDLLNVEELAEDISVVRSA